jgi:hypothetical protein
MQRLLLLLMLLLLMQQLVVSPAWVLVVVARHLRSQGRRLMAMGFLWVWVRAAAVQLLGPARRPRGTRQYS